MGNIAAGVSRPTGYIPTLDGWRAIAILMVLACHARDGLFGPHGLWPSPGIDSALVHGVLGVDVFFGISGFLITTRLLTEYRENRGVSLSDFYWRRFFRILPAAWTYLAAMFLCAAVGLITVAPHEIQSCFLFWRNYTESFGWYTGQFWSLMVEEHFYILWPAMLGLLAPPRACRVAIIAAIGIGCWRQWGAAQRLMLEVVPNSMPEHRTDSRLDALLWSCVVAISFPVLSRILIRIRWGSLLPLVFAGMLLFCGLIKVNSGTMLIESILRPVLIPLMIASTVVFPDGLIGRFLDLAPMRFIGKISYSLYLWQQPFLVLDSASGWGHGLGRWQQWPLPLFGLSAVAIASYYLIERPMIQLGGRLRSRTRSKATITLAAKVQSA